MANIDPAVQPLHQMSKHTVSVSKVKGHLTTSKDAANIAQDLVEGTIPVVSFTLAPQAWNFKHDDIVCWEGCKPSDVCDGRTWKDPHNEQGLSVSIEAGHGTFIRKMATASFAGRDFVIAKYEDLGLLNTVPAKYNKEIRDKFNGCSPKARELLLNTARVLAISLLGEDSRMHWERRNLIDWIPQVPGDLRCLKELADYLYGTSPSLGMLSSTLWSIVEAMKRLANSLIDICVDWSIGDRVRKFNIIPLIIYSTIQIRSLLLELLQTQPQSYVGKESLEIIATEETCKTFGMDETRAVRWLNYVVDSLHLQHDINISPDINRLLQTVSVRQCDNITGLMSIYYIHLPQSTRQLEHIAWFLVASQKFGIDQHLQVRKWLSSDKGQKIFRELSKALQEPLRPHQQLLNLAAMAAYLLMTQQFIPCLREDPESADLDALTRLLTDPEAGLICEKNMRNIFQSCWQSVKMEAEGNEWAIQEQLFASILLDLHNDVRRFDSRLTSFWEGKFKLEDHRSVMTRIAQQKQNFSEYTYFETGSYIGFLPVKLISAA